MEINQKKKLVIIGGGFGGINLIKHLQKDARFDITLVDRNNYHFFPPLLYQVSTSFIEPSNISYPFRRMFQDRGHVHFFMGALLGIDPAANQVHTDHGSLGYDILVLAMGTETNYFGMENLRQRALPMKTIDDALNLRNQLLLNVEEAARTTDPVEKAKRLNIVIAGGGATGVEISGMIAEMGRHILLRDYPEIDGVKGNIYLVDAGPALLGPMSKQSQEEALKVLTELGVQVKSHTAVKDYADNKVVFSNGESIDSHTLIWASGVIAREVPGLPEKSTGRGRRIMVDAFNKTPGSENIYVIGDQSLLSGDAAYPDGHPQLAQVAIQQAALLAANLKRQASGKSAKPFRYSNKGTMAIISKYKAVVDLPGFFFKGFPAWFVWLFIHIIPIAGYRNKAKLAFNWFWSFITDNPTLRLIIRPGKD
jgi:NADH dehydrogenase